VQSGVLTFQDFQPFEGSEGELCLNYVLDVRTFVVDKLPDDGTLVPKHAGVGTG